MQNDVRCPAVIVPKELVAYYGGISRLLGRRKGQPLNLYLVVARQVPFRWSVGLPGDGPDPGSICVGIRGQALALAVD